jgi:uncharacterized membrane protein
MYILVYVCTLGFHYKIEICIDKKNMKADRFIAFVMIYVNTDDDDVYLRLQHGKGFHNLAYTSYVKHIIPDSKA